MLLRSQNDKIQFILRKRKKFDFLKRKMCTDNSHCRKSTLSRRLGESKVDYILLFRMLLYSTQFCNNCSRNSWRPINETFLLALACYTINLKQQWVYLILIS